MNGQQKTQWISFLVVVGVFLAGNTVLAQSGGAFLRNLDLGSHGQDVFYLQKILNRLPVTQVANSGVGAPGQETTYFGPLTKDAVIRFQELYRSVILDPIGLSRGTGYVGPSTRAKLNELGGSNASAPSPVTVATPTIPTSPAQPDPVVVATPTSKVDIDSISPNSARRGQTILITGSGFTDNNTVSIGPDIITGLSSSDGKTLSVPLDLSVPAFRNNEDGSVQFPFWVYVQNSNGASNHVEFNYIP